MPLHHPCHIYPWYLWSPHPSVSYTLKAQHLLLLYFHFFSETNLWQPGKYKLMLTCTLRMSFQKQISWPPLYSTHSLHLQSWRSGEGNINLYMIWICKTSFLSSIPSSLQSATSDLTRTLVQFVKWVIPTDNLQVYKEPAKRAWLELKSPKNSLRFSMTI